MITSFLNLTCVAFIVLTIPVVSKASSSCSQFFQTKKSNLQNIYNRSFYNVNSSSLWSISGGMGQGVRLIDIEKGYNKLHKVFIGRKFFINSLPSFEDDAPVPQSYHGTAVLSIISARHEHNPMMGLAPEVELGFLSYYSRLNKTPEIRTYADLYNIISDHIIPTFQQAKKNLRSGDVLLVEMQVPIADPNIGIISGTLVPPTYYNSVREVLNEISQSGVYVVIPAGNMGASLDHPSFGGRFDRKLHSELIYVGSAESSAKSLLRLESSNYGSLIDTYGPGKNVMAADTRESLTEHFSDFFSGTSSAGAVIAGIVAQLSGIAKAKSIYISPKLMRHAIGEGLDALSSPTGGFEHKGYVNGFGAAKKLGVLD